VPYRWLLRSRFGNPLLPQIRAAVSFAEASKWLEIDDIFGGELMTSLGQAQDIPGTTIFDGREAMKGYNLNKMCYSFNSKANRDEFLRDEEAYCDKFGLNEQQRDAIRRRNVLDLIAAGGNIYYLAKFAGIFGLNVQDIGAQQTGMPVEDFKAMLVERGR